MSWGGLSAVKYKPDVFLLAYQVLLWQILINWFHIDTFDEEEGYDRIFCCVTCNSSTIGLLSHKQFYDIVFFCGGGISVANYLKLELFRYHYRYCAYDCKLFDFYRRENTLPSQGLLFKKHTDNKETLLSLFLVIGLCGILGGIFMLRKHLFWCSYGIYN